MRQIKYDYDAFISHAVEDKIPIANELCAKLEKAGLKIWYSGKELGVGDSIEKTIEKGLNRSRYGIVIFSPTYLAKNWTIREFYTLLAKEIEEHKVILPVLYNISLDELKNKDLLMADRFAVNSDRGLDFVVERLVREIRKPQAAQPKEAWFSRIWLVLILSLLANIALLVKGFAPPNAGVSASRPIPEVEVPSQNAYAALLGEMRNFLQHTNGCSSEAGQEWPYERETIPAEKPRRFQLTGDQAGFEGGGHAAHLAYAPGKKMTMALVIRIETPSLEKQDNEDEVGDMLETLGLQEDGKDRFITVSNGDGRLKSDVPACVHCQNTVE